LLEAPRPAEAAPRGVRAAGAPVARRTTAARRVPAVAQVVPPSRALRPRARWGAARQPLRGGARTATLLKLQRRSDRNPCGRRGAARLIPQRTDRAALDPSARGGRAPHRPSRLLLRASSRLAVARCARLDRRALRLSAAGV